MFRHPHYLEVPWDMHGHHETTEPHRHLWWLIALLVLLAMFLIGVGITSGLIYPALFMAEPEGPDTYSCSTERVRGASPPQGKRRIPGQSSCLGTLRAGG